MEKALQKSLKLKSRKSSDSQKNNFHKYFQKSKRDLPKLWFFHQLFVVVLSTDFFVAVDDDDDDDELLLWNG